MDVKAAWSKTAEVTNSATNSVTQVLDALTPSCAPFAARWDAEADRRAKLRTAENLKKLMEAQKNHTSARTTAATAKSQRTAARAASKNPLSAARRSAATADKAARSHRTSARSALKAAKANYPQTLTAAAVKGHAVHTVPGAVATYALSSSADWTVWPASVSALLIAANIGGLWLGRRQATVEIEDGVSAEERQLMERLDPAWWVQHSTERGLGGTVTTVPEITPGGIRCEVRLDGTWTVKGLSDKADSIRALLGSRTALRMRITSASRGGWAVLSLATRSAAADVSSLWTPELMPSDPLMMSLGVDTETGEQVLMPFDERLMISGASGTGKSWSSRPLMATAHLRGEMVFIDGKGEEATIWGDVCRCAVESDEITGVIDELHGEMDRRKADMKRRGLSKWDGQQLTVVIDEGQVVLALVARDRDRLQRLIELSSLGRSRGVVLWWATQYPVTDGGAPGVHKMIAPNLLSRISLRVAGTTQSQVALDDCAHYAPHQIPEGREYRGHGYLKGYGPRLIRTWTLDDDGVRSLPRKIWQSAAPVVPAESVEVPDQRALRLVKAEAMNAAAAPAGLSEAETAVLDAVRSAGGPARQKEIAEKAGLAKGTVSKTVTKLIASGRLVRAEDGTLTAIEVA